MQIYLVGGAVRDRLLGRPVQDRDHVVVGATMQEMVALGYTPVGRDFPVFLHPQTHEEYALARTERKTAPGYKGFVFHADGEVTLEQDLARRDLTINAMAQADDGSVVDPFGGQADLQARVLRHVSPAFLEDPVRILRVARFAARFTDFSVAPETARLMRRMVDDGEADALVPERVWQEFSRGLMESRPSRMIAVLRECGLLGRLLPALEQLWDDGAIAGKQSTTGAATIAYLDAAAQAGATLALRVAILLQAIARPPLRDDGTLDITPIETICARMKIPGDCRDLAVATGREREAIRPGPQDAAQALAVLERCDAFRKPERFGLMLDAFGWLGWSAAGAAVLDGWRRVLAAARAVDAGSIARTVQSAFPGEPLRIQQAVRLARIAAIHAPGTAPTAWKSAPAGPSPS
jgi:tRNA nucleotidyltransferase (CCA-adding enzyme)